MAVSIDGEHYLTLTDVSDEVRITRQTLWRWRQDGKVPRGRKYRGREVLFTEEEFAQIRKYAQRLEPIEPGDPNQLRLFKNGRSLG